MKNEETTYENEGTTLDDTQVNSGEVKNNTEGTDEVVDENKNKSTFRKAATGVGAGILLGSVAAFGFSSAANAATGEAEDNGNIDNGNHNPAWADDSVDIATSVSDDMTFSQAFAAARTEVGPGGAFEWHGNVYGTYTAEEWGNMTPEEKEEYNNHFNWSQHHGTSNSSAEESAEVSSEESTEAPVKEPNDEPAGEPVDGSSEEQIEVVSVEPEDTATDSASHATDDVPEVAVADETSEVEILGVVHDGETGANIGGMMVDGQEVFLIDVDGEGKFDYMAADLNHDGQIDQGEFADISAENIAVHQFDNSLNEDSMYASNDGETDYINDDVIA